MIIKEIGCFMESNIVFLKFIWVYDICFLGIGIRKVSLYFVIICLEG